MKNLISFLKSTGIVVQAYSSYNGLANTFDYGPIGALIKNKLHNALLTEFVLKDSSSQLIDSSILTKDQVLNASGHLTKFDDWFIDCKDCKKRFKIEKNQKIINCPNCKNSNLTSPRSFNLLFKTEIGALQESKKLAYLRPETAQGIFTNFNYYKTLTRSKIPFSICQFGKAFRNEIVPSNFLYRMLEFEQFEIERFIKKNNWKVEFNNLVEKIRRFLKFLSIDERKLSTYIQQEKERAHYSKKTLDFQFDFPFGKNELLGISYRQDYDLVQHQNYSKTSMEMLDEKGNKFIPHVVEASFGIDRLLLALFLSWYKIEKINENDNRVLFNCPYFMAPYSFSILPLSTKFKQDVIDLYKDLINDALKNNLTIDMNLASTSIGKKYRRNDQIGVPFCVTIDFETKDDNSVTIRDRNTMKQVRIHKNKIISYIKNNIK